MRRRWWCAMQASDAEALPTRRALFNRSWWVGDWSVRRAMSSRASPRSHVRSGQPARVTGKDGAMKAIVVRYQAKPERADENQKLIEAVFSDLDARQPE